MNNELLIKKFSYEDTEELKKFSLKLPSFIYHKLGKIQSWTKTVSAKKINLSETIAYCVELVTSNEDKFIDKKLSRFRATIKEDAPNAVSLELPASTWRKVIKIQGLLGMKGPQGKKVSDHETVGHCIERAYEELEL